MPLTSSFLSATSPQSPLVLILLNWTLPKSTPQFWKKASIRICADGGANRLYDLAPSWNTTTEALSARKTFLPTVIKGDLDSLRPEVADFYSQNGVDIVDLSTDQDSTDLQKCLACAEKRLAAADTSLTEATILAVGAFGGRLDHTLSNINTLYTHQHLRLVLCGEGSLARLLPAGRTVVQPCSGREGPQCGVIALGEPAVASSTGLKWDLDEHELAVGGLMSSSNQFTGDEVVVESNRPVLWTTQFDDEAA